MNETVKEWVAKAEADFQSALREFRARKHPNYDAACFFAQQCAEKLMKGLLISHRTLAPRTHNLVELHEIILRNESSWLADVEELRWLTRAAVNYRYPGNTATKAHATMAIGICKRLREILLGLLQD